YLDLWQDQLRLMAADPETMASFARMLTAATGRTGAPDREPGERAAGETADPFAWWPMTGAMPTLLPLGGATPFDSVFAAGRAAAEARAEASAASPDGGGDELRELERRLAAIEARLAALEPGARAGRRSGKGKARKGKS
ncbi:MAG: hypothetical protein OEQ29_21830, partial [Alphaproteobacteria bacterium]|nr:hypothetical protein [Alphaproteobacteria bacterium]